MIAPKYFNAFLGAIATQIVAVSAQCNPLKGSCPPIPGFAGQYSVDFTKVNSLPSEWILANYETVSFSSNGIEFTLAKQGDSPYIWTNQYLQYGYVEVFLETAPGIGVISSAVLLSDDLDEIDWEFSGNDFGNSVPTLQTNYYGKGVTGDYDRGTQPHISGNMTSQFHTYVLNWTPESLSWNVNGQNIRTLYAKDCDNGTHQYPQTPARFHLGVWDAGDPSVAAGTVQWAGGYTNMNGFPYTMTVQSVSIVPQNQCLWYNYTDTSGSSDSVQCISTNLVSSSTGTTPPSSSTSTSLPSLPPPTTTDTSLATSLTSEMTSAPSLPSTSSSGASSSSAAATPIGYSSASASASSSSTAGPSSSEVASSPAMNYGSSPAPSGSSAPGASSSTASAPQSGMNYGGGSSASAPAASNAPSTSPPNSQDASSSTADTSSNQGYATSASHSSASTSNAQASANSPAEGDSSNSVVASATSTSRLTCSQSQSISQSPATTPCYHDNCLRNLLDSRYSANAKTFCGTATAIPKAVPPMFEGCRDGVAMKSACSCFMSMFPAPTTTSATSSTPSAQQKEGGLGGFVKELMDLW